MVISASTIASAAVAKILLPTAKEAICDALKPILSKKVEDFKNVVGDFEPICNYLQDYLTNQFCTISYAKLISIKNQQILLKDIYVPLTINKIHRSNKEIEQYLIDGYPEDLIEKYKNIIIIDQAGMGKSTLSKIMFLSAISSGSIIPIFIELRNLSKEKNIIAEIFSQLSNIDGKVEQERLFHFIESGRFIFFFDGYDEIPAQNKKDVTEDIERFITKAKNNRFVITSREEDGLSTFGSFQAFNINDITREEAYELLRKYDNSVITEELIKKLEDPENQQIEEFLINPLLVSLLLVSFQYEQDIPLQKHLFYEKVYTALYESHDISKGNSYQREKKCGLNKDNFAKILCQIAIQGVREHSVDYELDELKKAIENIQKGTTMDFSPSDFIDDILHAVPLFTMEGVKIKWAHKSLQEYFAAKYIHVHAKKKQQIIKSLVDRHIDSNANLLSLYYDIDQDGFEKYVLKPYFEHYLEFVQKYDNIYNKIPGNIKQKRIFDAFITNMLICKKDYDTSKWICSNTRSYSLSIPNLDARLHIARKSEHVIYKILLEKKRHEIYFIDFAKIMNNYLIKILDIPSYVGEVNLLLIYKTFCEKSVEQIKDNIYHYSTIEVNADTFSDNMLLSCFIPSLMNFNTINKGYLSVYECNQFLQKQKEREEAEMLFEDELYS